MSRNDGKYSIDRRGSSRAADSGMDYGIATEESADYGTATGLQVYQKIVLK